MRSYAKLILLLLIPMALVMGYALSSLEIGSGDVVLEKADLSGVRRLFPIFFADVNESPHSPQPPSSRPDTIPPINITKSSVKEPDQKIKVAKPDLSKYRVMIFGDSMLEWLSKRLCDYTMENGYDLSCIIWYSSSTKNWAITDTLQYFLDRIQPDYVILCLGSNELFVRDLPKREKYIAKIVERLDNRPFLWIGPPNWKPDTGINDLIRVKCGEGRFFDSSHLELERASDNRHPSRVAAALWMDTIALWLNSPQARHPLKLDLPTQSRKRVYHKYVLRPPE
ncbi:MAG: SGNH/GDSL hydrolase family protein [Bacteroidales bacterium]|nr:SGNH/GDSL hydrolase family protein [Bacteroidales bacterium]